MVADGSAGLGVLRGAVRTGRALLDTMRPKQWTKNLIVFVPLVFASDLAFAADTLRALAAFAVFCVASGSVYLANDLVDRERDRFHTTKRARPLATGELGVGTAATALAVLLAASLAAALALGAQFGLVAAAYLALQTLYTFWLKHEIVLDVMAISAGFVLRAHAGAVVIGVEGSPWLYYCAALLALFLGLAKRRHELTLLEADAQSHRPSLEHYSAPLIDAMLSAVTAATIVTYALYTFFSTTGLEHQYLMLTVPFVVYGLFRYLYLVHQRNLGGSPEDVLLSDKPLIINIVLWLAAVIVSLSAG
ncbi:MAG TPA: decaprenyl-phosphate phosphoribosyltransferase [Coriobacteriia bacterium]|nr:decaprenyl-phosphate phosphoribosyltransferase [Coriobacteriia bacterium]